MTYRADLSIPSDPVPHVIKGENFEWEFVGEASEEEKGAVTAAIRAWTESAGFLASLSRAVHEKGPVVLYSILPKRVPEFGAIEELEKRFGLPRQSFVEMSVLKIVPRFDSERGVFTSQLESLASE